MKLKYLIGPVALVGILAASAPAGAQGRRERGNHSEQNRGDSGQRQASTPRSQPAPRSQPERRAESTPQNRPERRAESTPQNRPERRADSAPQNRPDRDRQSGVAQNRPVPRVDAHRGGNRYERPRTVIVQPRRPSGSYGYRSYGYRPYNYTFRPHLRVGFGVFLGYPVPYPYYDPYAYPAEIYGNGYPVYGAYPAPAPVEQGPGPGYQVGPNGSAAYGGVSLDISPRDAAIYVDGTYVGIAEDFQDPSHPLSMIPGSHRVQVQAPGYQPLSFDVSVLAGQVIPYQGDLQP